MWRGYSGGWEAFIFPLRREQGYQGNPIFLLLPGTPLSLNLGCQRSSSTYLSLPSTSCLEERRGDGLKRPGSGRGTCPRTGAWARASAGSGVAAEGTAGSILRIPVKARQSVLAPISRTSCTLLAFPGRPFYKAGLDSQIIQGLLGWGSGGGVKC